MAIKLPSMGFDFLCAWLVFVIVRMRYPKSPVPLFAFFAILFAPTVFLNSSLWGQTDILYTTCLVACIFFLLKDKGSLACLAYGIAFAFKFQAIFLAPFLLLMLIKRKIPWWGIFIVPGVYFVAILPVWIAGRPLWDLLTIYASQAEVSQLLTRSAPNLYAWLPNSQYGILFPAGLILAAGVILLYLAVAYKSSTKIAGSTIVQLAFVSAVIVPFFLPKMHERYFFCAEVLAIVYGFYFPEYFYIPIMTSVISTFTYISVLFKTNIIPLPYLGLGMLVVILIVVRKLMLTLYAPPAPPEGAPSEST